MKDATDDGPLEAKICEILQETLERAEIEDRQTLANTIKRAVASRMDRQSTNIKTIYTTMQQNQQTVKDFQTQLTKLSDAEGGHMLNNSDGFSLRRFTPSVLTSNWNNVLLIHEVFLNNDQINNVKSPYIMVITIGTKCITNMHYVRRYYQQW
ncbi:hypothetical protein EV127DRAFT_132804 [Xylaria flabelliformis]|nr:hypothetical protein EV127DRAFT_132804 [Xylaria flabelliformis]